jgi:riboflavin biosynthesis pyrimidine reductase
MASLEQARDAAAKRSVVRPYARNRAQVVLAFQACLDKADDHEDAKEEDCPQTVSINSTRLEDEALHFLGCELSDFDLSRNFATSDGVLLGSGKLATELERLDLIDEYQLLVHPRIAGHGPTLYEGGLPSTRRLDLISAKPLCNGAVAMHYRRAR